MTTRKPTYIDCALDEGNGKVTWDGSARRKAPHAGVEYEITLDDGYVAVYRPHLANDGGGAAFSMRGKLEIVGPEGAPPGQLAGQLASLNLQHRPMTEAEGEWSYLKANISAQGLDTNPDVASAMSKLAVVEMAAREDVFFEHMGVLSSQALSVKDLHKEVRRLELEAATRCLSDKVYVARDAVAKASGYSSGADLAAQPHYQPAPYQSAGHMHWSRWDVLANRTAIKAAFGTRGLRHRVSGQEVLPILQSGVLAGQEKRRKMGIHTNVGLSQESDMLTGGADFVFTRVSSNGAGPVFEWDDPTVLLQRADAWGADTDTFGAVNPASDHYSSHQRVTDPLKIAAFTASNNEVMFRGGIDLFGAEAPSRIRCGDPKVTAAARKLLIDAGITHLDGKPINKVII